MFDFTDSQPESNLTQEESSTIFDLGDIKIRLWTETFKLVVEQGKTLEVVKMK